MFQRLPNTSKPMQYVLIRQLDPARDFDNHTLPYINLL